VQGRLEYVEQGPQGNSCKCNYCSYIHYNSLVL